MSNSFTHTEALLLDMIVKQALANGTIARSGAKLEAIRGLAGRVASMASKVRKAKSS